MSFSYDCYISHDKCNGKYISLAKHVVRYLLYKWDDYTWSEQQSATSRLKHTLNKIRKLIVQKYGRKKYNIFQVWDINANSGKQVECVQGAHKITKIQINIEHYHGLNLTKEMLE